MDKDLNQAYLQMYVKEGSKGLLTITTQKGLFRYGCLTVEPSFVTSSKPVSNSAGDFFSQVEGAPVTDVQVKKANRTDPVLAGVMDMVMMGHSRSRGIQPYL